MSSQILFTTTTYRCLHVQRITACHFFHTYTYPYPYPYPSPYPYPYPYPYASTPLNPSPFLTVAPALAFGIGLTV